MADLPLPEPLVATDRLGVARSLVAAAYRLLEQNDGVPALDFDKEGPSPSQDRELALLAREMINERRARDRMLGSSLFGEPAWEILLDLFVSQVEGQKVSVSNACDASEAPSTTGLRYLASLTRAGLVDRYDGPNDRRLIYVSLSDEGLHLMRWYLRRTVRARYGSV